MSCVDTTDALTPHAFTTTFRLKCHSAKHVSANANLLWLLHLCRHIFCKACLHETIKKLKKCPSEDLVNLLLIRSMRSALCTPAFMADCVLLSYAACRRGFQIRQIHRVFLPDEQ